MHRRNGWFNSTREIKVIFFHLVSEFADTERIFLIDRDQNSRVWCVRDAIRLIDRFNDVQYRADPIRVYKDLSLMRNEAGEKVLLTNNKCSLIKLLNKWRHWAARLMLIVRCPNTEVNLSCWLWASSAAN